MVVTQELLDVTTMGLRDIKYDIGPFITLVDGPQFGFLWTERRSLLLGQINKADIVAVSRIDLIESDELSDINHTLKGQCSRLITLSANNGHNVRTIASYIE
jgi:G3E family GTPase